MEQKGRIAVIGIGPGDLEDMTPRARKAIAEADTIAGYHTYIRLIAELTTGKEVIGTGMMQEVDRCRLALEAASAGKNTVVISSGDAGIYGMAGLILELLLKIAPEKRPVFAGVVAGISAVQAAASLLGAPLMHDFAVISLSDLMTPWEQIKKRAELAAQGDFVIALYNPKSKKRTAHIEEIQQILLQHKDPQTPVGIVRNAMRAGQEKYLSTLANFTAEPLDMFSLVIIGNSHTYVQEGYMLTPRGYAL